MKIGISGNKGSFSEEAGERYVERHGVSGAEFIYLLNTEGVLGELNKGEIDVGIFPVANWRAGLVEEAFHGMGKFDFSYIEEDELSVRHSLLVKPGTKLEEITQIASHPQGLKQCQDYIKSNFPKAKLTEWTDTASAAEDLSKGELSKTAAAIARKRAGEIYGLESLADDIQDDRKNATIFIAVKK